MIDAMFDSCAVMLCILRETMTSLSPETASEYAGVIDMVSTNACQALQYVSTLLAQPLMYQGLMMHDGRASALMRMLHEGARLAQVLPGESQYCRHILLALLPL
jgi:hypothetical protein